jgi:AraC-like DNA-binding protein
MYREYGHWSGKTSGRLLNMHHNAGLELVSIAAGQMTWTVDGQSENVSSVSLFFTLPWQLYGTAHALPLGGQISWLVIPTIGGPHDWQFAPELQLPFDAMAMQRIRAGFTRRRHSHQASQVFHQHLKQTVYAIPEGDPLLIRSLVQLVIIEAIRAIDNDTMNKMEPNDSLRIIRAWLTDVRRDPLSHQGPLADEAARCGLGRTQFAKLVEQETGDTPNRYRTRQRILLAAELLRDDSQSITAIAFDVGFESLQHFARVFKKYMSVTPSAFASSMRQAQEAPSNPVQETQ